MKIHFERDGTAFEFEFEYGPMPEHRFKTLCLLAGVMFGGMVLLGLVHMLGVWGLLWPLAGFVLVGIYRLIQGGFIY